MAEARALRWRVAAVRWPPTLQRLVWVIAGLVLSIAPHAPHIRLWILLLAASAAGLRLAIEVKHWQLPPKWLRAPCCWIIGR
jgi:disulfide bond formation protein DsbB